MDTKGYKRPSDRNTKRGVSNDKVSIMVATDRNGGNTMQVAKVGRIDAESVRETIGGLVTLDNVMHINSLDNRYERWVKGFYGVSTKYLQGYLNWFVFLQKVRESSAKANELAKCTVGNMFAIKAYGSIDGNYEELMFPQLSKT